MAQVMLPQDTQSRRKRSWRCHYEAYRTPPPQLLQAGTHVCNTVTASIDRLEFHHPVFVGDVLFLKASLNMAGRSSMEIGVRVESENYLTGEVRHTASRVPDLRSR